MLTPLLLALALSAPPAKVPSKAPQPPQQQPLEDRRAALAKEVLQVAGRIQREIEAGDLAALLARVPPEGLRCGERVIPRDRVERDLRAEGSWLHGVLLGSAGAAAAPGRPSSLRAFFAQAREVAVTVAFREDPRSELGLPCFEYRSRDLAAPGAPLCLEKRDGRWWFADSLYPC
jgi:hypothetical protein